MLKKFKLNYSYAPDGVFETLNGEVVAFELELAKKSKSRIGSKMFKFKNAMSRGADGESMFSKVLYRCLDNQVFTLLTDAAGYYEARIDIEQVDGELNLLRMKSFERRDSSSEFLHAYLTKSAFDR